ncbi:MAG TPA: extracellular solute-binding protein [Candidatus Binatia bacterium]|jgi:iron(III) transport system substrate-binding protein|nr:extracellular solute-binding protein [Candidatus Binatia bacterium]
MSRVEFLLLMILFFGFVQRTDAAQAKPTWQQEWEKTLEAAKKEGQVVVYISGYDAVLADFEKEFPEIKVTAVTGRGNQLGPRLLAERRAEKFIADVSSTGTNPNYQQYYLAKALDPIKPALILPEVTDPSNWYLKRHQYSDPEGQYVFNYVGSATYGAVNYNTKLVDVKDFKSYWDLLNPKWKGKIAARDVREAGPGAGNTRFFYYHQDLGPAFIRKLFGEMEVTLFRDFRQGPDWLATGKYAICFFCDVDVLKQQGLPVDTFGPKVFKEGGGLVQQFGTLALINRAPHPNAAKVFINWLLSRRGQLSLQKTQAGAESPADSLRVDIPKDDVPLLNRRLEGIKYLDTGRPEWIEMKPILDVVNEALKAAGKN